MLFITLTWQNGHRLCRWGANGVQCLGERLGRSIPKEQPRSSSSHGRSAPTGTRAHPARSDVTWLSAHCHWTDRTHTRHRRFLLASPSESGKLDAWRVRKVNSPQASVQLTVSPMIYAFALPPEDPRRVCPARW
jgi:hypothetical protein